MKLTEHKDVILNLIKVCELAQANWPRSSDVCTRSTGTDPSAQIFIPARVLAEVCRAALEQHKEK